MRTCGARPGFAPSWTSSARRWPRNARGSKARRRALDGDRIDRPLGRPVHHRANCMTETVLNLRGLRCPLPALKTRKALTRLASGDRLVVECTDPLSTLDIPNLISQTGDVLEESANRPGLFVFRIKKA